MAVDVAEAPSLLPVLEEGKPDAAGWLRRRIAQGVILAVFLVVPLLLNDTRASWISLGAIYIMIGLSINVLTGYAGQVSLGHQAFVGIGAFTSALFVTKVFESAAAFWFTIVAAAATGAIAAFALGIVALRLKGLYLALVTLAYGTITTNSIFAIPAVTGGGAGVEAPKPSGFTGVRAYTYVCFAVLAVVWYLDWRLTKTKAGRAVFAIRENEIAAASFGINVVLYKLLAFVFSGAVAGVAGALIAHRTEFVVDTDFTFQLALVWLLMAAVGGLGSRVGVAIGSAFFAIFPLALPDIWEALWGPIPPHLLHLPEAIGALLLLLTLTLYPGGIAQQIRPLTDWIGGKPFSFKSHETEIAAGGGGVRP